MCIIEKQIIKTVELLSTKLDRDILQHIEKCIYQKFLNYSDRDYGMIILHIADILVLSNTISRDGIQNSFTVSFKAICYRPHINCVLQLQIVSISEDGILFQRGQSLLSSQVYQRTHLTKVVDEWGSTKGGSDTIGGQNVPPLVNIDFFINSEYLERQLFKFEDADKPYWVGAKGCLRIGDIHSLRIESMRYHRQKFNCICVFE